MANPLSLGLGKRRPGCLKIFFLFILVWFTGLFMGSYFRVYDGPFSQQIFSLIDIPRRHSNHSSNITVESPARMTVNAKHQSTTKPIVRKETNKPIIATNPTTKTPTIAKNPTTKKPVVAKDPTTKKPVVAKDPTTKKPIIAKNPTTKKPIIAKIPTTKKPVVAKDPTTKKPSVAKNPTTKKSSVAKIPTTKNPTVAKDPTTKKPSVAKDPTTKKPSVAKDPTTKKPSVAKDPTTKKPSVAKDPTTKKPSIGVTTKPLDNGTHVCPFPKLDPLDHKIKKFIKKYPTVDCSKAISSIVDIVGDELKVNADKVKTKLKANKKSFTHCQYRSISMKPGNDYSVVYGAWSNKFTNSILLGDNDDNVHVDCYNNDKLVARSYLARVKKKPNNETKRMGAYQNYVKENSPKETLSVFLIGIDGTSKQNFHRAMPKTKAFISSSLKAIEFHKFNKVGLNTFPNVVPLVSGLHVEELTKAGWNSKLTFDAFDHLFLWHDFQKAGYRTSMIQDMTRITAFHYLKKGWAHPSFDFYPRPIVIASEGDKTFRKKKDCMGDTSEVTLLHDYWLQMASVYNNTPSTPYFAYSFMARLTHDDVNKASSGDELYLKFFQDLAKRNVLNNTLVIFFSDHGARFGSIRNTYNGLIEAKHPFLFFMFPSWFEKKYPDLIKALRNNTDRLMTMFDVHETLKDILNFTGNSSISSPLKRGISLFSEIPSNRTCSVAGIPVKFCACTNISRDKVVSSDISNRLVKGLLDHVVSLTKSLRSKCEVLKHNETKLVLAMSPETPLATKTTSLYHVTIQTIPGGAVYEATVFYRSDTKAVTVSSGVARLNMYKGQAECIDDSTLRPFCFCSKLKR